MNDNLPPLPEPKFQGEPKDSNGLFTHWFIEEQMLEYGQLCRQQELAEAIKSLTDSQRMELFGQYCKYCGCDDPRCQCWNDEPRCQCWNDE